MNNKSLAWDMAHVEKPYRELAQHAKELGLNGDAEELDRKAESESATLEDKAQQIGLTVLHSTGEEELAMPTEQIVNGAENKAELSDAVDELTSQYGELFLDKIPLVKNNERNWLGKIKTGKERTTAWSTSRSVGNYDVDYDFQLRYRQGEQTNRLLGTEISIGNSNNKEDAVAKLSLVNDGTTIRKLGLAFRNSDFASDIFGDSALTDFLREHKQLEPNSVAFDLESGGLGVTIAGHDSFGWNWMHELRYDPHSDKFVRIIRKEAHWVVQKNSSTLPETYDRDKFMDLLKSTLELIPTVKV